MISKFFILLLVPTIALGDCQNAVRLHIGDTNKDCERIGYSTQYDLEVRTDLIRGDTNEKIVLEQKRVIEIKDLQIDDSNKEKTILKTEVQREREQIEKLESRNKVDFWIGLGIGALAILAGAWAIKQTLR